MKKNITKKECPNCESLFAPNRPYQKYCSPKCTREKHEADRYISRHIVIRTKTKICRICHGEFSFEIKRGRDTAIYCGKVCRAQAVINRKKEKNPDLPKCKTIWCNKKANRVGSGFCEACYCRERRTGGTDKKPILHRTKRKDTGYVYVRLVDNHPLVNIKSQKTYKGNGLQKYWCGEHRAVAYEKYGSGKQNCFWCGRELRWEIVTARGASEIVIDHLNEDKSDNNPENLLISCNNCNRARGAMIPFIKGLSPESIEVLIEQLYELCESHKPALTAKGL